MSDTDNDSVGEDPRLAPEEKETTITWARDEKAVHVYSEVAGIVNRLLHHPHFDEDRRRTVEGDVVAVAGTLPLRCITIKANPRSYGSHAAVVSEAVIRDD